MRVGWGQGVAAPALLAAFLLAVPGTAAAHARLVSSDPADGAALPEAPASLTLSFDSRVERRFARLRLIGPAGETQLSAGDGEASRALVLALPPLGSGEHRVAYSVVSADGHRIEGSLRFTVGR